MHIGKTILFLFLYLSIVSYSLAQSKPESPVFTQEVEIINQVKLYPNPAPDFIFVEISESRLNNVSFEMYNIIGNKVSLKVEKVGEDKYKIPVKDYAAGYYILILKDEGARYSQAFKFAKI